MNALDALAHSLKTGERVRPVVGYYSYAWKRRGRYFTQYNLDDGRVNSKRCDAGDVLRFEPNLAVQWEIVKDEPLTLGDTV